MENESYTISTLSRSQRIGIVTFLSLLIENFSDNSKKRSRVIAFYEHLQTLGVSVSEFDLFKKSNSLNTVKKSLSSLTDSQIEIVMSMIWELLHCDGQPSYDEKNMVNTSIKKIMGLSEIQIDSKFEKISALTNFFNNNPQPQPDKHIFDNVVGKNQNNYSFSISNFFVLIIIVLAIIGLVSLCSSN